MLFSLKTPASERTPAPGAGLTSTWLNTNSLAGRSQDLSDLSLSLPEITLPRLPGEPRHQDGSKSRQSAGLQPRGGFSRTTSPKHHLASPGAKPPTPLLGPMGANKQINVPFSPCFRAWLHLTLTKGMGTKPHGQPGEMPAAFGLMNNHEKLLMLPRGDTALYELPQLPCRNHCQQKRKRHGGAESGPAKSGPAKPCGKWVGCTHAGWDAPTRAEEKSGAGAEPSGKYSQ